MDDLHCLDAVEWCKQPPPPACAINPPARPVNNSRHLLVVDDCHAIPLRYFDLEGTRGSIVGPFPDKRRQADDHRPAPEIALPSGALQAAIRTVSGCGGGRATRPCHRHVVRRCGVCPSGALCRCSKTEQFSIRHPNSPAIRHPRSSLSRQPEVGGKTLQYVVRKRCIRIHGMFESVGPTPFTLIHSR